MPGDGWWFGGIYVRFFGRSVMRGGMRFIVSDCSWILGTLDAWRRSFEGCGKFYELVGSLWLNGWVLKTVFVSEFEIIFEFWLLSHLLGIFFNLDAFLTEILIFQNFFSILIFKFQISIYFWI